MPSSSVPPVLAGGKAQASISKYDLRDRRAMAKMVGDDAGGLQPNSVPKLVTTSGEEVNGRQISIGLEIEGTRNSFYVEFEDVNSPPRVYWGDVKLDLSAVGARELQRLPEGAIPARVWHALATELSKYI